MIPGEIIISDKELEINSGSEAIEVEVSNTGDRPIQVGSHYHFFAVSYTHLTLPTKRIV